MDILEQLSNIRKTEKDGRVVRRLCMLILFLSLGTFSDTGRKHSCDRRTVSMWWHRLKAARKTPKGIRDALSDKPRSGCPTKVDRAILDKVRQWCDGKGFESIEISDKIFELSGTRLSITQVRRYMRQWKCSKKKTEPIEINRAKMTTVRVWRYRLFKTLEKFSKKGYTIVTMDESHIRDSERSRKFWSKVGVRIYSFWSGNHHRFSMLCSMTSTGELFYNSCSTANTASFLEHVDRMYQKIGKMVLVLDRATYHTSNDAMKYFKNHPDIMLVWYPVGHPYLNPVEELWGVLKLSINNSIRYATVDAHKEAVFKFINEYMFDYNFTKFWKRKPPKGVMRPIVRLEGELSSEAEKCNITVPIATTTKTKKKKTN